MAPALVRLEERLGLVPSDPIRERRVVKDGHHMLLRDNAGGDGQHDLVLEVDGLVCDERLLCLLEQQVDNRLSASIPLLLFARLEGLVEDPVKLGVVDARRFCLPCNSEVSFR